MGHHRFEGHGRCYATFRAAEMAKDDDSSAFVGELQQGWGDALDAAGITDLAFRKRHVEIDADENSLSAYLDIIKRAEATHGHQARSESTQHGSDIAHAVGKAPFIVVPGKDAAEGAVDHRGAT